MSVIVPKRLVASLGSIQNFGGYFGGSFAPIITGWVVEHTGRYDNALMASAVIAVIAALVYFLLVKKPLPEDADYSLQTDKERTHYDVSR